MPWDKFQEVGEVTPLPPLPSVPPPAPDSVRIAEAAKLAQAAQAPLIVVGGGAVAAGEAVRALAERLGAPVVSYRSGRGVLDDDHPLSITVAAVHALWPKTDLVIGIGSRLEGPGWRWSRQAHPPRLIRIDIDPVEMRRLGADVAVVADAADATAALVTALGPGAAAGRRVDVAEAKRTAAALISEARPHYAYLQQIRAALPDDGFLVDEMCQAGYTSWFAFPVHRPRTIITSGFQGTLGSGFPTALGVAAANPGRKVVSLTGDGGFLFGATELATAVQFRLDVTVIVFENGAYGNVKRDQQRLFEGRHAGSDLTNPDFVRFAESFGVPAFAVDRDAEFSGALAAAMEVNGPALVHVRTRLIDEVSPWRFIAPGRP
jgi:acetolactate synthase-1/2/3 large subunit